MRLVAPHHGCGPCSPEARDLGGLVKDLLAAAASLELGIAFSGSRAAPEVLQSSTAGRARRRRTRFTLAGMRELFSPCAWTARSWRTDSSAISVGAGRRAVVRRLLRRELGTR